MDLPLNDTVIKRSSREHSQIWYEMSKNGAMKVSQEKSLSQTTD